MEWLAFHIERQVSGRCPLMSSWGSRGQVSIPGRGERERERERVMAHEGRYIHVCITLTLCFTHKE